MRLPRVNNPSCDTNWAPVIGPDWKVLEPHGGCHPTNFPEPQRHVTLQNPASALRKDQTGSFDQLENRCRCYGSPIVYLGTDLTQAVRFDRQDNVKPCIEPQNMLEIQAKAGLRWARSCPLQSATFRVKSL